MSKLHPINGSNKPDREADVVFIHGLGGGADATWRYGPDNSTSWLHWLSEEFPNVGVWSLDYPASPSKWPRLASVFSSSQSSAGHGMALAIRGGQVLNQLVLNGLGERPLFLIGHSLGGLVLKQLLRDASDSGEPDKKKVLSLTRAILFLATPHAGSSLGSIADNLGLLFATTDTLEDLRANNPNLLNLYNWFREHAPNNGIKVATYYETRPVRGITIVDPGSSQPGCGDNPIALDEDHFSIAKPRSREHDVYLAAIKLLKNHVLANNAPVAAASAPVTQCKAPLELPPAATEFFGRQSELEVLTHRLQQSQNTTVVGAAGLGKTALAAIALRAVVGETPESLARCPFPDGVVYLDLYGLRAQSELVWNTLSNKLTGQSFMEKSSARTRAEAACNGRRLLIVIEGGEEADGQEGRPSIAELLSVLAPQNRRLLLTRLSTQAPSADSVTLRDALDPADAAKLFDSLTKRQLSPAIREQVLQLLEGHPLALTWAGNLLIRGDDHPESFVADWRGQRLPSLADPEKAPHTLEWLFNRSVRSLSVAERAVLSAVALVAHAPFPTAAAEAALQGPGVASPNPARPALRTLSQRALLRPSTDPDHWQFTHVLGYRFARHEVGSDPEVRAALGNWLHGRLKAALALAPAPVSDHPGGITRTLEHLAALLRADDTQVLWDPLVNWTLYDLGDRLIELGRLAGVKQALGAVDGWLTGFALAKAAAPEWVRERSVVKQGIGNVLLTQGDLVGALSAYREALAVSRRLQPPRVILQISSRRKHSFGPESGVRLVTM